MIVFPPKSTFDEYYTKKLKGDLTWEEVLWNNRPLSARLTSWRHAYEAHRDARLVYAQAKIGRPMELRRRLYLGKYNGGNDQRRAALGVSTHTPNRAGARKSGGLFLPGSDGSTPREAAEKNGNTKCVAVIDEIADKYLI